MSIYDELRASIDEIVASYKAANADGKLSFSEIFTLLGNAAATFVQLVESFSNGTGAEKKAAVLQAIEKLFDEVIIPIDIKGIPNMLEAIVDRALKQLVMSLADGWVDSLVNIFNKSGWGNSNPVPQGNPSTPQSNPQTPQGDYYYSKTDAPAGFEIY